MIMKFFISYYIVLIILLFKVSYNESISDITNNATNLPSSYPSFSPTIPKTSKPTNPTSNPSSSPTSPTSEPSSLPSSIPTFAPSLSPLSDPSSLPTSQPSPGPTPTLALVGKSWWYATEANCQLWGIKPTVNNEKNLLKSSIYAFDFAVTDDLIDDKERKSIEVGIKIETIGDSADDELEGGSSYQNNPQNYDMFYVRNLKDLNQHINNKLINLADNVNDKHITYIKFMSWSKSLDVSNKIADALRKVRYEQYMVLGPLHEKGFHEINKVIIGDISVYITLTLPPTSNILSPVRIIWIIMGTIFLFMFAVFLLNNLRKHFKNNPNTIEFLKPKIDTILDWLSPIIKMIINFVSFVYINMMDSNNNNNNCTSNDGFTLASQEDQVSDSEEYNQSTCIDIDNTDNIELSNINKHEDDNNYHCTYNSITNILHDNDSNNI